MKKNDILKDLVKELDAIEIIEFKNYLIENLITFSIEKNSNSKIISNNKDKDLFCPKCGCKYKKTEFNNKFVPVVNSLALKLQIQ